MKSAQFKTKIILLLLFLTTAIAQGQNKLYVYDTDGSNQSFALSDIRKLTFTENSMQIYQSPTHAISWPINDISYMSFQYSPVDISEWQKDNLSVYPNPVTTKLTVKNTEIIDELKIFDLQGKIYLSLSPKKEITDIDMSSFPTGMYFLRIVSNNKVSTSKIIKSPNN